MNGKERVFLVVGLVLVAAGALVLVSSLVGGGTTSPQARRGIEFLQQGNFNEALAELRTAASLQPDSAPVLVNLGVALVETGDYTAAIPELQRAIVLDPESTRAYYNLGVAYFNSGDYTGAKKAFREAMKLDPAFQEAVQGQRLAAKWERLVRDAPSEEKDAEAREG